MINLFVPLTSEQVTKVNNLLLSSSRITSPLFGETIFMLSVL